MRALLILLASAMVLLACAGERPELVITQTSAAVGTDDAVTTAPPTTVAPVATDCAVATGNTPVPVAIQPDQAPIPCVRVSGFQRLEFTNNTTVPVGFTLGSTPFSVEPGAVVVTEPVGTMLVPGLNDPAASPHPVAAPWLVDPAESTLAGATMSLTGVGPITLGMTAEEAGAAAGIAFTGADPGCAVVGIEGDPNSPLFTLRDQRVTVVQVFGNSQQTPSAVGVGTTEADVIATYGQQLETQPSPDGDPDRKLLVFVPTDEIDKQYRLVFQVANGVVESIRTGLTGFVIDGTNC